MEETARLIVDGLTGAVGKHVRHRAATAILQDPGLYQFRATPLERIARGNLSKAGSVATNLAQYLAKCLIGLSGLLALSLAVLPLSSERGQLPSNLGMVVVVLAKIMSLRRSIAVWIHAQWTVHGMIGMTGTHVPQLAAVGRLCASG